MWADRNAPRVGAHILSPLSITETYVDLVAESGRREAGPKG